MSEPISPSQMNFLLDLVAKRDLTALPDDLKECLSNQEWINDLTKAGVSPIIDALKKLPYKPKPEPQTEHYPKVNDGYYFIVDPTNGEERFFKVKTPTEGRWEGYTFVEVQASDFFHKITSKTHRYAVLEEIAKDPITAMNEYGLRLGRCGNCNRTLTARGSRLKGIGPICEIQLMGEPTDEDMEILQKLGLV